LGLKLAHVTQQDNTWHLKGDLVVEDIVNLLTTTRTFKMGQQTTLDFAEVGEVDTSAVSLILELKRRAQLEHAEVGLKNMPSNLLSLIQLYGVDGFVNA
jgi:phospholipid transport system transporter-binding protein